MRPFFSWINAIYILDHKSGHSQPSSSHARSDNRTSNGSSSSQNLTPSLPTKNKRLISHSVIRQVVGRNVHFEPNSTESVPTSPLHDHPSSAIPNSMNNDNVSQLFAKAEATSKENDFYHC